VDGELRELRCHYGRVLYRILYRRSERLVVLLHVFAKRSAKIEERDIRVALERWRDFRARMDAPRRVPPRAAGRDAP
jgi:phage-related protein